MKTFYFFSFDDHKFIGEVEASNWLEARKIVSEKTGFPVDDMLPYTSKNIWSF